MKPTVSALVCAAIFWAPSQLASPAAHASEAHDDAADSPAPAALPTSSHTSLFEQYQRQQQAVASTAAHDDAHAPAPIAPLHDDAPAHAPAASAKPGPDEALAKLKVGNERFVAGNSTFPHLNAERIALAGRANQGDYAYATVISCSDSRVPVELVFDAGVMDLFVIRVAGNVCDTDEIGSIEYGVAHVNTPVLVVLGHKQCGAVTAVTHAVHGHGHALERNIPPLVDNIEPAVRRAIDQHPDQHGDEVIPAAIIENVWQGIDDLLTHSPAVRKLMIDEKLKVVGAIYDVGTGRVEWLAPEKPYQLLARIEASQDKITEAMATAE